MYNHTAPDNFIKRQAFNLSPQTRLTLGIGCQVGQIATMMLVSIVMTMRLARGVVMPLGGARIRRAAIANFMDMETVLTGRQTRQLPVNPQTTAPFGKAQATGNRTP